MFQMRLTQFPESVTYGGLERKYSAMFARRLRQQQTTKTRSAFDPFRITTVNKTMNGRASFPRFTVLRFVMVVCVTVAGPALGSAQTSQEPEF